MSETIRTSGDYLRCPYCETDQQWRGDPIGEDESAVKECISCGRAFEITPLITRRWRCSPWEDGTQ